MKVLHIITRMNTGGPAVFLDHLTNAMGDIGTNSTIAYGFCESNETDYVENHEIKAKLIKIETLHRSLNPFDDMRTFLALRRVIKEVEPDLVNTHTSKAGVLGRIAAKSIDRRMPVVHTYHGHLIYGYFAKYKIIIFTLIERLLAQFTNAAVSITKETQTSLQKLKIGKKLKWIDPYLGTDIKNDIKIKEVDESILNRDNEYDFFLPISKTNIKFKLITHGDEMIINKDIEASQKALKTSNEITTRYRRIIIEVDGVRDAGTISNFVTNRLLAGDSKALRKYISDISPDLALKFDYTSPVTGETEALRIPFGIGFFYPAD